MLRADHQEMADTKPVKVGAKVEVAGKGVIGTVAYIGTTLFSSGNTHGPSFCLQHVIQMFNYLYINENQQICSCCSHKCHIMACFPCYTDHKLSTVVFLFFFSICFQVLRCVQFCDGKSTETVKTPVSTICKILYFGDMIRFSR